MTLWDSVIVAELAKGRTEDAATRPKKVMSVCEKMPIRASGCVKGRCITYSRGVSEGFVGPKPGDNNAELTLRLKAKRPLSDAFQGQRNASQGKNSRTGRFFNDLW